MRLRDDLAPLILLLIRDGQAQTFPDLVSTVSHRYAISRSPAYRVCHDVVRALQEAGLVDQVEGKLIATDLVWKVQAALGISLSKLSVPSIDSMVVTPIFGTPESNDAAPDVFVLMPFAQEMKPIYDDHIKKVCLSLNLTVARADDFFSTQSVIEEIWSAINKSRILIADCTGRNPNVFYEIGLAHAVGRRVILLSQEQNDMPFDLAYIRRISYTYTPRGIKEMEEALVKTLSTELKITNKNA